MDNDGSREETLVTQVARRFKGVMGIPTLALTVFGLMGVFSHAPGEKVLLVDVDSRNLFFFFLN